MSDDDDQDYSRVTLACWPALWTVQGADRSLSAAAKGVGGGMASTG